MKVKLISFVSIVFLAGVSCTSRIDLKKEKEAIIAVIEEETDAFYARDFDRMSAAHVQDETEIRIDVGRYGHTISRGWGDASLKDFFLENPEPSTNYEKKTNYQIKVHPGSAWAVYDNDAYSSEGQLLDKSVHIQFLEKVDGRWKIANMTIVNASSFERAEENRRIAALYHELKPDNIDLILTDDFIGRWENDRHVWNKESHRNFLSSNTNMTDSVYNHVVEGDWVATRFRRSGKYQGRDVNAEIMQFKRFQDGRIAEIFEYFNSSQLD